MDKIALEDGRGSVDMTKKQRKFWDAIFNGATKKEAYLRSHPDADEKWAAQYGYQLYNKKKFEHLRELKDVNMWERYKEDANEAYEIQKNLMQSPETKDSLKNDIANKIQDRAGYSPVEKRMSVNLNQSSKTLDKLDTDQLLKISKQNIKEIEDVKEKIKQIKSGKSDESAKEIETIEAETEEDNESSD